VEETDAVVVGAGFAGLYALHRLRGQGLSVRLYEAGDGVGGTWYWNTYPGARCDFESVDYSYSFDADLQQEWTWTERYPSQPEILAYLNHVADRFDLRRDIRLGTRVAAAHFDEEVNRWTVGTDAGERVSARFLVMATGCLSVPRVPDFPGLGDFRGRWFHTGNWPRDGVDFAGERVAVIGTGSSGIQVVPEIARQAEHLYVLQRTPSYVVPAQNGPLDPAVAAAIKADYAEHRRRARESFLGVDLDPLDQPALSVDPEARQREYEERWRRGGSFLLGAYPDLLVDTEANDTLAQFIHGKIRETVRDPEIAELLTPRTYPVGARRLVVDTDYYATFNRDTVSLVDLRGTPLETITPTGFRTTAADYTVDSLVFATGFDAITGPLLAIDIRGCGGRPLADKWSAGPRAYLGVATAGFPNLFLVTGPGSPSVLSNMVLSAEQHVDWIAGCVAYLAEHGLARIEPTVAAEDAWAEHVGDLAGATVFPRAESWYVGANVPGKPRVFMPYVGGVPAYRQVCEDVAARDYDGFTLSAASPGSRAASGT
jgi:cyclohexanone monooxygenase